MNTLHNEAPPTAYVAGVWDAVLRAAAQSVEPEPDERGALHGVLSRTPLADGSRLGGQSRTNLVESLLAAGFRRSRPEATHTVTAERYDAAWLAYKRNPTGTVDAGLRAALAALGITVVDTPTQDGGDA